MGTEVAYNMGDEAEQYNIETADAGASDVQSVEAGQIRQGGYIMIKGKPCKVKSVSVSKTGKHGHAKGKFSATDIFTGATCEELCPSSHNIDTPVVTKKDYMIQGIQDDIYVLLMDESDGSMREDVKLPNVDFKTDDDDKTTNLLQSAVERLDNGESIEVYCTRERERESVVMGPRTRR